MKIDMPKYILGLVLLFSVVQFQILDVVHLIYNKYYEYSLTTDFVTNPFISLKEKNLYKKELTIERVAKWKKIKTKHKLFLYDWLNKEVMLYNSWEYYKKTFITEDGRVIDYQNGNVTTSEGQAYAMRRALIMGDRDIFDKVYNWTKWNLQREEDNLFAWLWGQKSKKHWEPVKYGIIDNNAATDADIEIAVCLIHASKFWNEPIYREEAQKIMNDIWDKETIVIKGERIVIAGIYQKYQENVEINPSYFLVHSFRVFHEVDKKNDWPKLIDSSYRLLDYCIDNIPSGLPPDVFYINKNTGKIIFDKEKSDFSYDAIRVFYRVYVDYELTRDPRAEKVLSRSKFFIKKWKKYNKFYTNYKQNGELKNHDEAIGSIAILVPVINLYDKRVAAQVYNPRIMPAYHSQGYWSNPMDYYAQNLVWYGHWLYQDESNIRVFKY